MSTADLAAVADELPDSLKQFAEEIEDTPADPPAETVEATEEAKTDPLLEKAKSSGWRPKEEWQGDPDEWVDHAEFVRRKPLFDKIHSLNKAIKDRDQKIEKVSQYAKRAFDVGREKAIQELEAKRDEAVQVGDLDAFKKADKELEEARKEVDIEPEKPAEPAEPEIPPVIQDFAKRNEKWFEKDKAMTVFVVEQTKEYSEQGLSLQEALQKAEADVKREFAHRFTNPNKERAGAVGSNNPEVRAKTHTYADLNQEQRDVWSVLKKSMTFEEYVEGLKQQGDLK